MIEYFKQLELREQLVLGVGALLAVLIIGWNFVWSPLSTNAIELRESVRENARLVVDLRRAAALRPSAAPTASSGTGSALTIVADDVARRLGLTGAIQRSEADAGDTVLRVSLRDAPFNSVIDWLWQLERQHGISVQTVSGMTASRDTPGFVSSATIVLERS